MKALKRLLAIVQERVVEMNSDNADGGLIRRTSANDLDTVIELCAAHAAYECTTFDPIGLHERLSAALFGHAPRIEVFVAECHQNIIGYAACSNEFSTWTGRDFLHMDCLFVIEAFRGRGFGRKLIEHVFEVAKQRGIDEVQWQTPDWYHEAIEFYRLAGATTSMKMRFKQSIL